MKEVDVEIPWMMMGTYRRCCSCSFAPFFVMCCYLFLLLLLLFWKTIVQCFVHEDDKRWWWCTVCRYRHSPDGFLLCPYCCCWFLCCRIGWLQNEVFAETLYNLTKRFEWWGWTWIVFHLLLFDCIAMLVLALVPIGSVSTSFLGVTARSPLEFVRRVLEGKTRRCAPFYPF